jgi:hypothetical protein
VYSGFGQIRIKRSENHVFMSVVVQASTRLKFDQLSSPHRVYAMRTDLLLDAALILLSTFLLVWAAFGAQARPDDEQA